MASTRKKNLQRNGRGKKSSYQNVNIWAYQGWSISMKLSIKDNCRPNFTSRYRHTTPAKVTQSCPSFWEANSSKQCSSPGGLWAQERRPHSLLFWERQTRSVSYQWRTSEMSQTCRICCNTRCKRGCENWQVRCVYSLCHLILETRAEIQRSSTTPRGGGKILALLQRHSLG